MELPEREAGRVGGQQDTLLDALFVLGPHPQLVAEITGRPVRTVPQGPRLDPAESAVGADHPQRGATTSLNLDRRQKNGLTLREQYLEGSDPVDAPSWMNCSFGVNVALETGKDGKMLFSRRSAQVAGPNSGRWNSSANEGIARQHDLPADGSPISLHAVARRALLEELAVYDGDATDIELLGLGLDVVNHQWAAFFRAVAPELDEATLRLRWSRGVTDKWEHDRFEFVDAEPESVFGFIADEPEERWTPCAPTLFYLALARGAVRRANGDPAARFLVEQAEQKVIRDRGL
ncbi:hypothetical protein ACWEV9_00560 [Streptomyces albogriseolus]|uniref:hypothetical protein n=1 Tax=Streptomyces albogriseolus TaxID=1887 RepID=UPI003460ECBE